MCERSQFATSSHFLIRSADRNDFWNSTPSKFSVNLSKPLKGTRAVISFLQMPATYYNITSTNNKIKADIGAVANTVYSLTPGNYTLNDLMTALQTLLTPLGVPVISFDNIANLMTIANNVNFSLDFNFDNSLSVVLGFSPLLSYSNLLSFTGQKVPKLFDSSIYIGTNFATHIQTTSKLKNVSFVIPHNVNKNEVIQFYSSTQFALYPKIKDEILGNLEFTAFNEKGELLQGLGEWQIMIEII